MEEKLTKKERKQLRKEELMEVLDREERGRKMKKWGIILAIALLVLGGGGWLVQKAQEPPKPKPGTAVADQGREHVADLTDFEYNSNPPTSGPHFALWAKRGVYDRVLSDGYLIHSLEHGYVVISYNCEKVAKQSSFLPVVLAHEDDDIPAELPHPSDTIPREPLMQMKLPLDGKMAAFTPETAPEKEVELPESFSKDACKKLVNELYDFLADYQRVIIVPRPTLDTVVALTAWNRIEKLSFLDREKIKAFIQSFHNAGPEKTVE